MSGSNNQIFQHRKPLFVPWVKLKVHFDSTYRKQACYVKGRIRALCLLSCSLPVCLSPSPVFSPGVNEETGCHLWAPACHFGSTM